MEKIALYICCSHLYIPSVLSEYLKRNRKVLIYTDKKDIRDFFLSCNVNVEVFFDETSRDLFRSRLQLDIKRKKKLKSWILHKRVTDVFFFHEGYCEAGNWLMLQLAKRENVLFHYVPIAKTYFFDRISQDKTVKTFLKKLYCVLIWGYFPLVPSGESYCSVMPQTFYKQLHIEEDETITINSKAFMDILSETDFPSSSIVLLENPEIYDDSMGEDYCVFLETAIAPLLEKHNVIFKNHPGKSKKIGIEGDLKEIPSFISGNLLTRRFACFIGVNSALLCEAANDGTKAICIAKLVDIPRERIEYIVNYHKELSNNVLYPSSVEEFWAIVES